MLVGLKDSNSGRKERALALWPHRRGGGGSHLDALARAAGVQQHGLAAAGEEILGVLHLLQLPGIVCRVGCQQGTVHHHLLPLHPAWHVDLHSSNLNQQAIPISCNSGWISWYRHEATSGMRLGNGVVYLGRPMIYVSANR
jgi:hypothetical protein